MAESSSQPAQHSLFPDKQQPVVYEQPLNERIRNCLRLEHLFTGIEHGVRDGSEWSTRDAIARILEISDFLTRSDIKGELIKELEREIGVLGALRSNPGVDPAALDEAIADLEESHAALKPSDYQPGGMLRADELASQIRQRLTIPGGACSFDVPALHFWLSTDGSARNDLLQNWLGDLRVIERATRRVLRLIRRSSSPRAVHASAGFFQEQIDPAIPCQLVRVVMPADATVFPEISGGKHRFTIRFCAQLDTQTRPVQTERDVEFELHCCGI